MVALLDDVAVLHHEDRVRVADRRQTMGDHERRAVGPQRGHRLLHEHLRAGVDRRRRLVEDEQGGLGEERTSDGDELAFARGHVRSAVLDLRVVAVRQRLHEAVDEGRLRSDGDLVVRGIQSPVPDVVPDGPAEQHCVLQHHPHLAAQHPAVEPADVDAVQQDPARVDVIEAHEQIHERGLARTGGSDDRDRLTGLCHDGQIRDERLLRGV